MTYDEIKNAIHSLYMFYGSCKHGAQTRGCDDTEYHYLEKLQENTKILYEDLIIFAKNNDIIDTDILE